MISCPAAKGIRCVKPAAYNTSPSLTNSEMAFFSEVSFDILLFLLFFFGCLSALFSLPGILTHFFEIGKSPRRWWRWFLAPHLPAYREQDHGAKQIVEIGFVGQVRCNEQDKRAPTQDQKEHPHTNDKRIFRIHKHCLQCGCGFILPQWPRPVFAPKRTFFEMDIAGGFPAWPFSSSDQGLQGMLNDVRQAFRNKEQAPYLRSIQ